jgi:hypothetical protein
MGGPNSGRRPNLERREKARQLRKQGYTLEAIGSKLGVSKEAVRQMLIACGLPRRLPKSLRNRMRLARKIRS